MRASTAAAVGLLLAGLAVFGASACATTTTSVGVGWGVSVSGGPYPYGWGGGPRAAVGVYGRPY